MKRKIAYLLAAAVVVTAGILLGFMTLRTPAPYGGDDETAFSAVRARDIIAEIAAEPHSVIAPEAHERVYAAICARLTALGLTPVTRVYPTPPESGADPTNDIKNISAVLDGASDNAILLVAHYDSACNFEPGTWTAIPGESFGAADDGYGVATIFETLRALVASGAPLQNDVMVLFTDAEEIGLYGVAAELKNNLAAYEKVRLVINIEARGVRGPALMFETGRNNAAVIAYFARYAKNPVSPSFATAVYNVMPNDTDFSGFKYYGFDGLNFAVVDGLRYYHTAEDNMENIDLSSLQHYGDQIFSLVRGFAFDASVTPLSMTAGSDSLFFNILPGVLLTYGETVSVILLAAAVALFAALVALALRKHQIKIGKTLLYAALLLASLLVLSLVAEGLAYLLSVLYGERFYLVYMPYVAHDGLIFLLVTVVAAALLGLFWRRRVKRKPGPELQFAGILVNLVLSALLTVFLPSASYIAVLPALLGLLHAYAAVFLKNGAVRHAISAVAAVLVLIIYVPLVYLVFQALTIGAMGIGVFLSLMGVSSLLPMLLSALYPGGAGVPVPAAATEISA